MTQPSPLDLKQIQAEVLDPDTLLLEYALGQERSYLWIVSSTSIAAQELPKRTDIESVARRVYESLTARNRHVNFETPEERRARVAKADAEYNVAASALSRMILAPASALMSKKRLLIVSDGALQYLPFSALPAPDAPRQNSNRTDSVPLIAMHEVVTVPSASTLAVLRKEIAGRKPASKMIAVLADPVFGKDDERLRSVNPISKTGEQSSKEAEAHRPPAIENALTRSVRELTGDSPQVYFPRLPSTRTEAEAIVKLVPENQAQKALDFAANKNWLTDPELSNYRFVHLATHTILNSTTPALSGILLSLFDASGAEREGFLAAQEIYNLKLPVDLVVLSSCKTGLGKEIKGEGIIGITRGFMYAGAARVLVSLWDVDDESTAEIMKNLYQRMLDKQRLSPAAALRSSQVLMWKSKRWHAPYFWAAFVLQGEYK
jgi:CHAT domain-containing protein